MSRLSRRRLISCLLLCAAAVAGSRQTAQAQSRRQSILPTSRELSRLGLERAWWSQATLDPGRDQLIYLTADEDAVYAQSRTGILSVFDAETGQRLWSRLLGTPESPSYPVVSNDNQVLLATGMNLFALEKRTGRQLWLLKLPHHPSTAPGIDDTQAYIGTLDGSAYAYNLDKIRELYEDQLLPEYTDVAQVWRYSAGTELTSPPVSTGRNVVFASRDGSLYAISQREGKLAFQFETNGAITTPIGRTNDSLFVASEDVRLFCIRSDNGLLRWTFVPGLPVRDQPQIVGQSVFITPERSGLYSLSTETGFINWHQGRGTEFLTATDDRVYASDDLGNVLMLSAADGAVIGTLPMPSMRVRVNNDRTDRIFLAASTGVVLSLKETGRGFPRYHKFPERQPILPLMGPAPEGEEPATTDEPAVGDQPPADEAANPFAPQGAAPVAPEGT